MRINTRIGILVTGVALCLGGMAFESHGAARKDKAGDSGLAAVRGEKSFDTLTIGTRTYTNVTVTTRSRDYIFLLHSQGMGNFKVAELTDEEKEVLGYAVKPKATTNMAKVWAKQALKKMDTPQVQKIEKSIQAHMKPGGAPLRFQGFTAPRMSVPILTGIAAVLLGIYLFGCYCCALICKKAGSEPGAMIWIPVLQMFPMLRAAGMSPLWFVATLLPVLNIVAHIVWCVRISKARGKGIATAIFLILPVTNFFVFLFLAFSDGKEGEEENTGQLISLKAA